MFLGYYRKPCDCDDDNATMPTIRVWGLWFRLLKATSWPTPESKSCFVFVSNIEATTTRTTRPIRTTISPKSTASPEIQTESKDSIPSCLLFKALSCTKQSSISAGVAQLHVEPEQERSNIYRHAGNADRAPGHMGTCTCRSM